MADSNNPMIVTTAKISGPRYMVNWPARILTPEKVIHQAQIKEVMLNGFSVIYHQALANGQTLSLEFYIKYRSEKTRIRLKTQVVKCVLLSNGNADLDVAIIAAGKQERHQLNNILQIFGNAQEFSLKK